jgi:hypothetical protein
MCPFCIGAATWAAAGAISAGGLGVLAAVVSRQRPGDAIREGAPDREFGSSIAERPAD